jgi:Putative transcriptional regulator
MPNMVDSYFAKSVIFICEDDANGTMGIIVNKPISQMKIINAGIKNKIFEDIINESEKIFFGGPVGLNEACIVQETTGKSDDFSEKIELSTDLDLIQEILFNEKTPKDTKLIFGHASWGKNQLQEEIKRGDWLIQEYSNCVFKSSPKNLWNELIHTFGLDIYGFIGTGGFS